MARGADTLRPGINRAVRVRAGVRGGQTVVLLLIKSYRFCVAEKLGAKGRFHPLPCSAYYSILEAFILSVYLGDSGSQPLFSLFCRQYLPLAHFKAPLPPGL